VIGVREDINFDISNDGVLADPGGPDSGLGAPG
jgi:hypothetical protein